MIKLGSKPSILKSITIVVLLFSSILAQALECVGQVPILKGESSAVSTAGYKIPSRQAWKAFDGHPQPGGIWMSIWIEMPGWIQYEFDNPTYIDRYSIVPNEFVIGGATIPKPGAPRDFELQGSNGSQWVTLDTRSGEINWPSNERRSYNIANPGAYKKYRLNVTRDATNEPGFLDLSIMDLSLEKCSCEFGREQVPVITGDSTDLAVSGIINSRVAGWHAFDSSHSTMWISEVWETPAWISYNWPTPRFIDQYSIKYSNGRITTRAPRDWELQGWNGSSWITVDTRNNQTNWSGSETRHYTVASPGSYQKYRLYMTEDNDIRSGIVVISIGNLSLRGCR